MTIFINYRRDDSAAVSRGLHEDLRRVFGQESVFMDSSEIRVGENWENKIDEALVDCKVMLTIIGPSWLRLADRHGRRRIDQEDDWVRKEIKAGLSQQHTHVIPILVENAVFPESDALPNDLKGLLKQKYVKLRTANWRNDLTPFIERLVSLGMKRDEVPVPRPIRPQLVPRTLYPNEIEEAKILLSNWKLVQSYVPGDYPKQRNEFIRCFIFDTFENAIKFMMIASDHISQVSHHPRWENEWKSLTIALTTWDIGNNISDRDLDMAQFFDHLFDEFRKGFRKTHYIKN